MPKDPLEPLRTSVRILLALTGAMLALVVVSTLFGSGSLFGWGTSHICVDATNAGASVIIPVHGPEVSASTGAITFCASDSSAWQRVLGMLTRLPSFLLFAGALWMLFRLIRAAERHGVYSDEMTRVVRRLGWLLVGGSLVAMVIEGMATSALIADLTTLDSGAPFGWQHWHFPLVALLAGLGVVSFARIMRIGTRMREDLDGTV